MKIRDIPLSAWVALVLLMGLVFLMGLHTLTSIYQDIGRHLTFGEIIWKTGSVPRTNLVSYTAPGFPFVNHHWLGEVFLYLGERVVGLSGLIAVKALLLMAAFGVSFFAAWRRSITMPSILIGLLGLMILTERTDVRPEILSFFFLGWFLYVLYRKDETQLIWTLPLVQLLWVNTHIYFFMGPFVFLAWAIGLMARDGKKAFFSRRVWLLGGVLAVSTLLNPWGLEGAFYPFQIFGNYGYSIVENQSYFFLRHFGYPAATFGAFVSGFVLVGASYVYNRRRIRENIMGLILVGATTVLSLMMVRNYPLFALTLMPVVMQNLHQGGFSWRRRGVWLVNALLLLMIASVVQGQLYRYLVPGGREFGLHVPQGHQQAVEFFRREGLKGPIFNNFDIGSYLIWKLPEEKVFIDGRPEAYPAGFIQDTYIRMQERYAVWLENVELYEINTIFWNLRDITPWSRTFLERLAVDDEWVPVYIDDSIGIFLRDAPENAALIERLRPVES